MYDESQCSAVGAPQSRPFEFGNALQLQLSPLSPAQCRLQLFGTMQFQPFPLKSQHPGTYTQMQSEQAIAELKSPGYQTRPVLLDLATLYSVEHTAERYWAVQWNGAEGCEVVVDLWSGAVGIVDRNSGSEDCTTSGGNSILYLPELKARMQGRFSWLADSYLEMKGRAAAAGYGTFLLLCSLRVCHNLPGRLYWELSQLPKTANSLIACRLRVPDQAS